MKIVFKTLAEKYPAAADSLAHQFPKGSKIRDRAMAIAQRAKLNADLNAAADQRRTQPTPER